jgi:uncharacterized repeat protein (TIGR01451 family)
MLRLAAAVLGAFALIGMILHFFLPVRPVFGEPEAAGLQVDKVGPNTGLAGRTITYSIIVTNAAGVPLSGVVVTDTWNTQGYTGTYAAGGGFTVTAFTLVTQTQPRYAQFSLTDLPIGARGVITINMVLSPLQQPQYNRIPNFIIVGNSVVISTSTPNVAGSNDRVDTTIIGPLLKLTKTVTPTSAIRVRPGRLITYAFRLENLNRADTISATNVVVTERLPANTLFYAAYPPSLAAYYPASNTVQWNLVDPLPVSGTVYLTLTARVTPTLGNVGLNNPKINCGARSDELPLFVLCEQDALTSVDDLFEKVAETISPPSQAGSTISRTFPNRVMSYTVYVYNPFPSPVSGMIVTDTLPTSAANNPSQTFQYIGIVASAPPGPPSVISQSTRIVAWQLPEIPGWGVYTFTFRVFVPPQMRIEDNQVDRIYQNRLDGSSSGMILPFNDGGHDDRMKVRVVRQIEIVKVVTPTRQTYGQAVTYTLILSNNGPTTISNIFLTDTLPTAGSAQWCGFLWDGNISSQNLIAASGNLVTWGPFTVPANSQLVIGDFRAKVLGGLNATCRNTVEGTSPDTTIVKMTQLAPVVVEIPFRYSKTVNPTSVVLGGNIEYTVREYNIGGIDVTMDYFEDILPPGFYFQGSPVYTQVLSPPLVLQANHGNEYVTAFTVDVLSTNQCDNLPKAIQQEIGTFGMRIIAPPDLASFWANSASAAPVTVHPQARANKTSNPPSALPGEVVTFTIVLSNNTASTISDVRVTDTLPNGFVFGGVLPGTDSPISIVPPNVIWINQVIPANGTRSLAFTVTAPITVGNYANNVKASSDTDPLICIPKFTLQPVSVRRGLIEVNKTANPSSVGPFATFLYNISLKNNGPYTITMARFTETLPGLAGYKWTFVSMQSGDPVPDTSNPHAPAWTNLTIGPNATRSLRFNVRTGREVGTYPNDIFPATGAGYMTATLPARWELTRPSNYNGAPVTVIPGVGLLKEVDRPEALAGQDVAYTITLANVSGQTINNVRLTDTLPSGFVFKQVIGGDGGVPVSINPLVWALGNMANNQQRTIVFRVGVPANQPSGTYYNRVTASADNISIAPTGNIAPVRVSGIPALDMGKSVDPPTVIAGREVTYTITLANNDPDGAVVNARITDTLPPNFSFTTMISGPNPAIMSPQVVWTGLNVPTQTVETWVFRARVASGAPDGTYTNRVDGSSPQTVFNSTGQTAPVEVIATPTFDVQVSKSDGAPTATIGGRVVYTIQYTNTLNRLNLTAKNAVLTETFSPAGYLVPEAPGWNFVSTGVYTRLIGDVPAGASGAVTFALQINSGIPQEYLSITNTVRIGSRPPDDVPEAIEQPASNNLSTDLDAIRGADIVVLGFTAEPANPRQGKPITVVVRLQNQGIDPSIGPESTVISGWFGIDLYVKPDNSAPPSGPSDRYLGACPTPTNPCTGLRSELYKQVKAYNREGLAPGETWVVTFTYVLPDGGIKWLYVQADPFWAGGSDPDPVWGASAYGRIREANEQNNIHGPVEISVIGNVYLPVVLKNR